jgi:hypothetical protein
LRNTTAGKLRCAHCLMACAYGGITKGANTMKLSEILDALLFAACIAAPFAAFFYIYGA